MKRLYKFWFWLAIAAGASTLAASADVATNQVSRIAADPPAAPTVYHFIYYPDPQVYYLSQTRMYSWNQDGTWTSSPHPPDDVVLGEGVNLDTTEPEPWVHQEAIAAKFPPRFHIHHYDHYHQYLDD